jgi:hypothetical protein
VSGPRRDTSATRFGYRSPWFSDASALPLDTGLGHPGRLASVLAVGIRRPRRIVALIVLLLRTRSEEMTLSQSPAGRELRRYFDERFLGVFPQNRLCRAVLLLPQGHADYLRGRHRQALRTNLRRASAAGIRCDSIADASTALAAAGEILDRRSARGTEADLECTTRTWAQLFASTDMTLAIARDQDARPLALMAAIVDASVCVIHVAVASNHEARWALHDYLVRLLIARGVRYLLSEGGGPFGALGFPPEVHHYQQLLGYELRHLVPRRPNAGDAVCLGRGAGRAGYTHAGGADCREPPAIAPSESR